MNNFKQHFFIHKKIISLRKKKGESDMNISNDTQVQTSRLRVLLISSASVGPLYISSLLRREGHTVRRLYQGYKEYLGEPSTPFSPPITEKELKEFNPDIIGFSIEITTFNKSIEMASEIKDILPNSFIIFGGPHPTIRPEETIEKAPIDAICIGEGEYPMLELCDNFGNMEIISKIPNLWVKYKNEIYKNHQRPYLQDLDSIPLDREDIYYAGVFSGRGCVGNCAFCNTPNLRKQGPTGKYYRKRDIDRILDEIQLVHKDIKSNTRISRGLGVLRRLFGNRAFINHRRKLASFIGRFTFIKKHLEPIRIKDDAFIVVKKWFVKFAQQKYKRMRKIKYVCLARANAIDEEVASWLYKSGCIQIILGFESGSDRLRNDIIHKNLSDEKIYNACNLLNKYGIEIVGQWIYGLPGETVLEALSTFIMSTKVKDWPQLHFLSPLPGTEIFENAIRDGYIDEYFHTDGFYYSIIFHKGEMRLWFLLLSLIHVMKDINIPETYRYMRYLGTKSDWRGKTIGEVIAEEMENAIKYMDEDLAKK
jgi:radical SAM superfamily enzyme YgiQ (UPF0313 family)